MNEEGPHDLLAVWLRIAKLEGRLDAHDSRFGELTAQIHFSTLKVSKEITSLDTQGDTRFKQVTDECDKRFEDLTDKLHSSQIKVAAIFATGATTMALLGALIAIVKNFLTK